MNFSTVYLIDGKPHRTCDCPQMEPICQRDGHQRMGMTCGYATCMIPAPDSVVVTYGDVWVSAKVTRVCKFGLGFVDAAGTSFPFTFDRIDGYRGEQPKEIGLRKGADVQVCIVNGKVDRIKLQPSERSRP